MTFPYRSIHEFFTFHGLCHKNADNWRLTKRTLVEITGLPNLSGFLTATNGILAYLEIPGTRVLVGPVHLEWAKAVDQNELLCAADGTALDKGAKTNRETVQVCVNELLALLKT